jgi:hypothetical protein
MLLCGGVGIAHFISKHFLISLRPSGAFNQWALRLLHFPETIDFTLMNCGVNTFLGVSLVAKRSFSRAERSYTPVG